MWKCAALSAAWRLLGLVLLVSLLPSAQAHSQEAAAVTGATYYVATNGNDSNPGTIDRPWRTIEKANQSLRAGDTVLVRGGAYNETIAPSYSGASGRPITYQNYNREQVTVRGYSNEAKLVQIYRSYIIVDGFTLQYGHPPPGGNKRWGWVQLGSDAQHNIIRNCRLIKEGNPEQFYREGYNERGFGVFGGANYNRIENNYIRGLSVGILIGTGSQYNQIRGNYVTETGKSAIVVETSRGAIQGNLIEGNTLERSTIEDGIQFLPNMDAGVDQTTNISNFGTIIRNNVIRHNAENAIDLKGAAHVVIEGNIIYGTIGSNNGPLDGWNRQAMHTITRGKDTSTRDVIIRHNIVYDNAGDISAFDGYKVYHNTVLANNRDYTGSNSTWGPPYAPYFSGIYQRLTGATRIGVKNNIVGNHNQANLVLRPGSGSVDVDYNLYFQNGSGANGNFTNGNRLEFYSFADWSSFLRTQSSVAGKDQHNVLGDPLFVKAPARPTGEHTQFDFALQRESPAIDRGGPLTWAASNGSGRQLPVGDAGYFFDGFGVVAGDQIQVGGQAPVRIVAVDYGRNVLTLERDLTWRQGDWVTWPYKGNAPDIGALESGTTGGGGSAPTSTPTAPPQATPTAPPQATPTAPPQATPTIAPGNARITIILDAQPNSTQNFRFISPFGDFKLDDAQPQDSDPHINTKTITTAPGTFNFRISIPRDWRLGAINCTPAAKATVDLRGRQVSITVERRDDVTCTFVTKRSSTVRTRSYHDVDGSQNRGATETALSDRTMTLYNQQQEPVASAVTNQFGKANFNDLEPGEYTACEAPVAAWRNSQPGVAHPTHNQPCYSFTVQDGEIATMRFGNQTEGDVVAQGTPLPATVLIAEVADVLDDEGGYEESPTPDPDLAVPDEQTALFLPVVKQ
jgi:hypothetical protein